MRLTANGARTAGLVYMALPTALFFLFTLKWWLGIPAAALVAAACAVSCRRSDVSPALRPVPLAAAADSVKVKVWTLLAISLLVLLWCVMAGQGGFVAQTWDWNSRNATLRDLVMHDWPVTYRGGTLALSYYIGHWVPPALAGRLALALTGSAGTAWSVANAVLLAWTFIGVMTVMALLSAMMGGDRPWKQLLLLALLVFFSQTDRLGDCAIALAQRLVGDFCGKTYDSLWGWWTFQFSSNSELLYWVFNQTVVPWIAILLVAGERSFSRTVFVVALCLLCGPMPAVGIAFFAAVSGLDAFARSAKDAGARGALVAAKDALTFENAVGALVVVPLVYAYLSTNTRGGTFAPAWTGHEYFWKRYVLFVCCETGLYLLLAWRRRNVWWLAAAAWICICPLVKLGNSNDFCMRASIPAFFVLMVLMAQTVAHGGPRRRLAALAALACGSIAVFDMMGFFLRITLDSWPDVPSQDRIYTYARRIEDIKKIEWRDRAVFPDALANNLCVDPGNRFFYRRLARTPEEREMEE